MLRRYTAHSIHPRKVTQPAGRDKSSEGHGRQSQNHSGALTIRLIIKWIRLPSKQLFLSVETPIKDAGQTMYIDIVFYHNRQHFQNLVGRITRYFEVCWSCKIRNNTRTKKIISPLIKCTRERQRQVNDCSKFRTRREQRGQIHNILWTVNIGVLFYRCTVHSDIHTADSPTDAHLLTL